MITRNPAVKLREPKTGGWVPKHLTVEEVEFLRDACRTHLNQVAERCGLRDRFTPHVLRHTLATLLLNQGAPLEVVQSILGHSKPSTTQLYATLSGSRRRREFEKYFMQ